jgi:hypothetical protein
MRRRYLFLIPLAAAVLGALPAPALASRTRTPVRILEPSPGNATVAGFDLRLVKKSKSATATAAAAKLPKGVSVVAVVAKQKRTDRVRGVIVVLRKADTVSARAAASTVTIDLRHAAIPSGFSTTLAVKQRRNVLDRGRAFTCSSWFRASDLKNSVSLGGPALPGLSSRDAISDACASARSRDPYAGENEFRTALNARAGFLTFTRNAQAPTQLDGSASFNYPVGTFTVLADKSHSFTACVFPAGSCKLLKKQHASDYAVFTPATSPEPSNTPLAFGLVLTNRPKAALPFEFFGLNQAGTRFGPLLTSGP